MIVLKGIAAATVLSVVGLMVGLVLLIPTVATASSGGVEAATGILTVGPSHEALDDIPESILAVYLTAAARCRGLSWTVLAGIGKVESNHGRYGGAIVDHDGNVTPPIIGIPLNGRNDTAAIPDGSVALMDRALLLAGWSR